MRIQNNSLGFNALRNLGIHNNRIAKAMQRLSSGCRINSAADDPAGFAVSEKLKMQITKLDTEKKNAIDYQSALQIADGSLGEVQSMLNRMYELSNMAQNGIYGDTDREQFDKEYQQLLDEINRIGSSSTFNGHKLFGGKDVTSRNDTSAGFSDGRLATEILAEGGNLENYLDEIDKLTAQISEAAKNGDDEKLLSLGINRGNGKTDEENLKDAILEFTKDNADRLLNTPSAEGIKNGAKYSLVLSGKDITVDIYSVDSRSLGLENSNLLTQEDAKKAADALKGAISQIASQRGSLGATYNRLEHTINNLSNMSVNLTDALSRILDTDMAREMMILTKEKILAQASTFVLAQANQQPNQVITLINSM